MKHIYFFLLTIMIIISVPDCISLSSSDVNFGEIEITPERLLMEKYGKQFVDKFTDPQLFEKNHIIAYYGHPNSKIMGIVGRETKQRLAELLREKAATYDKINGEKGVIPAIYLIYGTCQPGGKIGIMTPKMVKEYIDFAIDNGFLIYLDHQIGKYTLADAMNTLLPFLKYPNVHLAIDVEWRTDRPMKQIGHIRGNELNDIQLQMKNYILENKISGKRQLVFHQFNYKMLRDSSLAKSDYDPVMLVHTTSGWGGPKGKVSTHALNSKVSNIPNKGFKLWLFYSNKKGVHFDSPLMSPETVLALNPQPGLIIYQ